MPLLMDALLAGLHFLVAAALLLLALVAGALGTRLLAGDDWPRLLRRVAAVVGAFWVLTVVFHVLVALRRFELPVAFLSLTAVAALLAWKAPGSGRWFGRELRRSATALRRHARHDVRAWALVALALVGVACLRAWLVPPLAWDSLTYHLTKSAMWVQEAGPIALRAPGPWDTYLGLAGGGEALFAWAMLPGRSDTLVGLADALVWPLLGLAVAAAGREAGLRWRAALQAAAFVMAIPAALLSAGTNYVDNLLAFLLLAALAFALRALCRGDARAALACCAALGLAFGVKLTALGPAAAMVAMLSLRGARAGAHERRQASWRAISLGLVLAAAAGLPWYVDNWRRTGLPFSPYPVRLLGFTLGGSETFDWYAKQSVGTPFSIDELVALRSMFHEPFQPSLGPMTVLAILLFPMALVRLWRRDRWSAGLAGLLALSALATYVSGPFAATRLGWASVNGRYFLMPVALCVLLGYRVGGRAYAAALGVASVLNVLLLSGVGISAEEADLVLGHVLLCVALFWLVSRVSAGPRRAAAAVLAVAAFAASVALWRETRRHELIAAGMRLHPIHKYWVGAAARLDALGPLRIAITAGPLQKGDHWFTYPFLGSHLQHRLVYLPTSADGALYLPNDPRAAENANADAWIERVRTSNVDAVVSLFPPGIELRFMEAHPERFVRLDGIAGQWGVFGVRR